MFLCTFPAPAGERASGIYGGLQSRTMAVCSVPVPVPARRAVSGVGSVCSCAASSQYIRSLAAGNEAGYARNAGTRLLTTAAGELITGRACRVRQRTDGAGSSAPAREYGSPGNMAANCVSSVIYTESPGHASETAPGNGTLVVAQSVGYVGG